MPRLTENVLINGTVRLAGEDISAADAKGVRPEVFEHQEQSRNKAAKGPRKPE